MSSKPPFTPSWQPSSKLVNFAMSELPNNSLTSKIRADIKLMLIQHNHSIAEVTAQLSQPGGVYDSIASLTRDYYQIKALDGDEMDDNGKNSRFSERTIIEFTLDELEKQNLALLSEETRLAVALKDSYPGNILSKLQKEHKYITRQRIELDFDSMKVHLQLKLLDCVQEIAKLKSNLLKTCRDAGWVCSLEEIPNLRDYYRQAIAELTPSFKAATSAGNTVHITNAPQQASAQDEKTEGVASQQDLDDAAPSSKGHDLNRDELNKAMKALNDAIIESSKAKAAQDRAEAQISQALAQISALSAKSNRQELPQEGLKSTSEESLAAFRKAHKLFD